MKRTKVRVLKKRLRNLIILGIVVLGLIVAYKMYPQSKSEKIITADVTYIDLNSKEEISCTINTDDYDNGYYFELPDNINGFKVCKYYLGNEQNDNIENEEDNKSLLPGERYYISEEEINSGKIALTAVYDIQKTEIENLYYKKLQTVVGQNEIRLEGYMPQNADINIKEADFKQVEEIIKESDESLSLNIAYDIKILVGDEKYEPNEFDQNVKVTLAGIVDKENTVGLKVIHIDEEDKIEELNTISIDEEDLTFSTETFSVFAIVSPSVTYSQGGAAWNGSVATRFAFGTGTANDPYLISNGSELAYLRNQVNNGQSYVGSHFKLISNINLNYNAWTPIGTATNSFSGEFDGQGFTISNTTINANGNNNQMYAYGIFGSIAGNANNTATIKNVAFDNINVNVEFPNNYINNNIGYKIGIVTGAMYRYARVENVIAKNSQIRGNNNTNVDGNSRASLFVGGIVGETAYSAQSSLTQVTSGKFVINNCYSDVDINIPIYPYSAQSASRMAAGGILGRDSWHTTWPTNCLYQGTIGPNNSNMIMGPIMGGQIDRNYDIVDNFDNLSLIWELDPNMTMSTCYYTNSNIRGRNFTSSWTHGSTPRDNNYRNSSNYTANTGWFEFLSGVNKGNYTNSLGTNMLNMFNQNASNAGLARWTYTNNNFSLQPGLDVTITETSNNLYTFTLTPQSAANNPQYTYQWYINNTADSSLTTNSASFEPSFEVTRNIQILVKDGTYVTMAQFTLERLTLGVTITQNNGTLYPSFTGSGANLASFDDYDIQWSEIDVIEGTLTNLATTQNLSGIETGHEYQINLTNGYPGVANLSATYLYGQRNIVYVNNTGYNINGTNYTGNNNNNGATPQTAVNTMERAYQLINQNGTIDNNIIVIMGNYNSNEYLDVRGGNQNSYNSCVSKFSKDALVTGKYKGTNYNARLFFACEDNQYNGRYLCGDTRFEYITFNGNNGRTFLYLQGHDVIMGTGIVMTNYGQIDSSDFGQIKGLGTPNFNMFCGFHNYNYSSIPTDSKVCNVLIRSGTFRQSCNWRT